jgi:hypothetical protein
MTAQEMNAEIDVPRLEQAAQRKLWRRFGFAGSAIGVMLYVIVLLKVAITGNDPPAHMTFIVLTYVFLGIAFTAAGRSITLRGSPRR